MRVMILIKADADTEAGKLPSEELLAAMGRFNEELAQAGLMLAGEGLRPTAGGVRVHFAGDERTVTRGPFSLDGGVICGYWVWQVASMDEAVAWVRRCPNPLEDEAEIETRPLFEADDFGEAFTSELREQEDRVRAIAAGNAG